MSAQRRLVEPLYFNSGDKTVKAFSNQNARKVVVIDKGRNSSAKIVRIIVCFQLNGDVNRRFYKKYYDIKQINITI